MHAAPVVELVGRGKALFEHSSPSQVELYRRCPRLWYDSYILGLKAASTPAQELGTAVHAVLEAYLKDGTPPPDTTAGNIARVGLHLLPPPGVVRVEGKVEIPGAPVPMVGIIDWIDEQPGAPLTIGDHKTASDKKWVRTKDQLEVDVQLMSYVHYGFSRHPDAKIAKALHTYFGTRGEAWADQVSVLVTHKMVQNVWDGICETIRDMQADAVKDEPAVKQIPTACSAYGGCHLKSRCWGAGREQVVSVPVGAQVAEGQELVQAAEAFSAITTVRSGKMALLDDLQKSILGTSVTPSAPPQPASPAAAAAVAAAPAPAAAAPPAPRPDLPGGRDGVNPPELPVKETDTGTELTAAGAKKTKRTRVPAAAAAPAPVVNGKRTKKLYIGCWPTKGVSCMDFSDWVAPFQEAVAKARGVPHIAAVDFGRAYSDIVVEVRHHGWPDDVEAFYIDPMGSSKGCVEVLIQMADEVVHKL